MPGFNQKLDNLRGLKSALETQKTAELKKRFETVLQGRFSEVPNGNFITHLPGVESITIIRQDGGAGLSLVVFYDEGKRHETFSLLPNGTVSGRIPDGFPVDRQQILDETIRIADSVDVGAWHQVHDSILPSGLWPEEEAETHGETRKHKRGIDPERVGFMRSQDDFLFGFLGENSGFRGYYGSVFPWGIVLENDKRENAAYFIDFPERLLDSSANMARIPPRKTRISKDEAKRLYEKQSDILEKYWSPVAGMSKLEARASGLRHFAHRGQDWKNDMNMELQKRRS
jgi:hypothetical protein